MRNQFWLLILGMCCLFLSTSSQLNATPSKHHLSFSRAVALTRLAIKHSDLKAFLKLCARQIVLEERGDIHPPSEEARKSLREDFPIINKFKNDDTGYSNQATLVLNLDKPLSRQDQRLLKAFFDTICVAAKGRGEEMGRNLVGQGVEGEDQFGPALQGGVYAGRSWRLGFENVAGKWEIRYVILADAN